MENRCESYAELAVRYDPKTDRKERTKPEFEGPGASSLVWGSMQRSKVKRRANIQNSYNTYSQYLQVLWVQEKQLYRYIETHRLQDSSRHPQASRSWA